MKGIALFGAGKIGQAAKRWFQNNGRQVSFFVDNNSKLWGEKILDTEVISLLEFIPVADNYELILSCSFENREVIRKQLADNGIDNYSIFDERNLSDAGRRETVVSYAHETDMEDVILYHVLHDAKELFYIDVGSNDPWMYSVTKLLYDKGARGINIDPNHRLMEITKQERQRDINLCVGIGAQKGKTKLFYQGGYLGGMSTTVPENIFETDYFTEEIDVMPLWEICQKYLPANQEISFMKVDVEGAEKEVLNSMDFSKYRPWIVVVESTLPGTDVPNYVQWEDILLNKNYHYAASYGVNRYYVSNEKQFLDRRFIPWGKLLDLYRIFHASPINDWG